MLLAALLSAGCGADGGGSAAPEPSASFGWHGVEPQNPPVPRAESVLRDTAGRRSDFAAETRGRPPFSPAPPAASPRSRRGDVPR